MRLADSPEQPSCGDRPVVEDQHSRLRTAPAAIRSHMNWRPWFVMYAEHRGKRLALADAASTVHNFEPHGVNYPGRYMVGVGREECEEPETCTAATRDGHARVYYAGDDLAAATGVVKTLEREILCESVGSSDDLP
jgi:hypothetical protein